MTLETTKTFLEIVGLILVTAAAFLIWLMSAIPKAKITAMFWYPDTQKEDTPFPLSVQIHFYNPAVGSVVVTEVEVNRLILEQSGRELCRLSPFAFLEPLHLTDTQRTFSARTSEFVHEFLLKGHAEVVVHIGFHFDLNHHFQPLPGDLNMRLEVLYTGHDPFRKFLRLLHLIDEEPVAKHYVYAKNLAKDEAQQLGAEQTTVFLARGLPGKSDLKYVDIYDAPPNKT